MTSISTLHALSCIVYCALAGIYNTGFDTGVENVGTIIMSDGGKDSQRDVH